MDITTIFFLFGITIFIGFFGEWFFEKTTIPDVVWLILLGFILGIVFKVSSNTTFLQVGSLFTTFALIFILFEGVLNINLRELFTGVVEGSGLSIISFVFSIIFTGGLMLLFGWGILESILLGIILGDASQAVIIPLLKKIRISSKAGLILTFETAISDVFCIVGALTVINIYVLNAFSLNQVIQKILYSFVLALFIGTIFGFIWVKIHRLMDRFSKSYMTTIAALLLVYCLVEWIGANGALACLAFGIVVGSYKKILSLFDKKDTDSLTPSAKFFFSQISFFVKIIFFVYLGLIINIANVRQILIGVGIALMLFIVRALAVKVASRKLSVDKKNITYLEILNPKGLSAAVLAQLPFQYGMPHGSEFSTIVFAVIISSTLFSIFMLYLTEKGIYKGFFELVSGIYARIHIKK